MSRIFTIFTTDTYTDPLKVIDSVINKDLKSMNMYSGSFNYVKDIQNNNLLHLATLNEHIEMVKHLLKFDVDKNHKNKFGLTPWDYAIRSHNKDLINAYVDYDSYHSELLKTQNDNLHKNYKFINEENRKITSERDSRNNEIVILKTNNKRLRDQNSNLEIKINMLTSEKDHLINENEDLVQANKKLKTSVDSLTQAMRK